ncbi:MAG: hypothetical protein ACW99U_18780 [Candidatus Thorarchaeota archaeon]
MTTVIIPPTITFPIVLIILLPLLRGAISRRNHDRSVTIKFLAFSILLAAIQLVVYLSNPNPSIITVNSFLVYRLGEDWFIGVALGYVLVIWLYGQGPAQTEDENPDPPVSLMDPEEQGAFDGPTLRNNIYFFLVILIGVVWFLYQP